jgi:hypothetical protein
MIRIVASVQVKDIVDDKLHRVVEPAAHHVEPVVGLPRAI